MKFLWLPLVLLTGCSESKAPHSAVETPAHASDYIRITEESTPGISDPGGSRLVGEVRGDTPGKRRFIDELWKRHHASFSPDEACYYGPDASFTQIEFVHGAEQFEVGSWHLVERTNPRLFASSTGLGSLGERTREQALAEEPESYRKFRASFDAIYDAVLRFNGSSH